jgi:serine/threonine protein kinase, bacterial
MGPFWSEGQTAANGSVARVPALLSVTAIADDPDRYLAEQGTIVDTFDHRTQDSGNVSWVVEVEGRRLFVKSAGADTAPAPGAPVPYLDHAGRVALLRNAVTLARSVSHPALPRLLNVLESPWGPVLVYEAAAGELVGVHREHRADPASAYQRFARAPAALVIGAFDQLIDVHVALAEQGWVAVDLYDGCLVVDFATGRLAVVDLDTYRRGPSTHDMGRMFGSTLYMAPEEFELGAPIDQRTTVFTLGRLAWHFGTRLTERPSEFCGPAGLAEVVQQAIRPSREERPATVAELADAWRRTR